MSNEIVISECSEYKGYKFKIEVKYKDIVQNEKHDVLRISEINNKNVFYNKNEKIYDFYSIKDFCEFKNNQEKFKKNESFICIYDDFVRDLEKEKSFDLALIKTNLRTALRHL